MSRRENKMAKGSSGGKGSGSSYSSSSGKGSNYSAGPGGKGTYLSNNSPGSLGGKGTYFSGSKKGTNYTPMGPKSAAETYQKSSKTPQLYQGKPGEKITMDAKVLGMLVQSYMSLVDAYVSATSQMIGGMYGSQPAPMTVMQVGRMDDDPILELYWNSVDQNQSIDSQVKNNQYLNKPKVKTKSINQRPANESSIDTILNQNKFKQQQPLMN